MMEECRYHEYGTSQSRRGFALVAVLWIIALLALLATGIGSSSRTDIRLAYNAAEQAKAKALADGGVHQALFELSINRKGLLWQNGMTSFRHPIDGGGITVFIRDEDGKLDINVISLDLWRGLLSAIGLDDGAARVLADRIIDFRGPGDSATLRDNEESGYGNGAVGRPFLTIAELLDVPGMTSEIYRRLRPHITVYAEVEGLDPARASITSLKALPGMTQKIAEMIAMSPPGTNLLSTIPEDMIADIETYLLPSRELFFSIDALGVSEQGGQFVRKAIVALDGGGRTLPLTVRAWQRDYASPIAHGEIGIQ